MLHGNFMMLIKSSKGEKKEIINYNTGNQNTIPNGI
jgi:hypothetical protein